MYMHVRATTYNCVILAILYINHMYFYLHLNLALYNIKISSKIPTDDLKNVHLSLLRMT